MQTQVTFTAKIAGGGAAPAQTVSSGAISNWTAAGLCMEPAAATTSSVNPRVTAMTTMTTNAETESDEDVEDHSPFLNYQSLFAAAARPASDKVAL